MVDIDSGVSDIDGLRRLAGIVAEYFQEGVRCRFGASGGSCGHDFAKVLLKTVMAKQGKHGIGAVGGNRQVVVREGCLKEVDQIRFHHHQ